MQAGILFVHLGETLPPHLTEAVYQASLFTNAPIYIVAEEKALAGFAPSFEGNVKPVPLEDIQRSPKHTTFLENAPFDRDFRDGFWLKTTQRFFVVEDVMRALGLTNIIHLESDVLIYDDPNSLALLLQQSYSGMATTFLDESLCVPGLVYIPDAAAMAGFTDFIMPLLSLPALAGANDMLLLALYAHKAGRQALDFLPVVTDDYPHELATPAGEKPSNPDLFCKHFRTFEALFDACVFGQHLGGVDPRNLIGEGKVTTGFRSENALFDAGEYALHFVEDEEGRRVPMVKSKTGVWPLLNLHMHSKNLKPYLSLPMPQETA